MASGGCICCSCGCKSADSGFGNDPVGSGAAKGPVTALAACLSRLQSTRRQRTIKSRQPCCYLNDLAPFGREHTVKPAAEAGSARGTCTRDDAPSPTHKQWTALGPSASPHGPHPSLAYIYPSAPLPADHNCQKRTALAQLPHGFPSRLRAPPHLRWLWRSSALRHDRLLPSNSVKGWPCPQRWQKREGTPLTM